MAITVTARSLPAPFAAPMSVAATWRLILEVTLPFWLFMTCERVITYLLASTSNPMVIIAPPDVRIGQHLLLLPLLLICYRGALAVGWPQTGRTAALWKHLGLAGLFALAARPALVVLTAYSRDEWSLLHELIQSELGSYAWAMMWLSSLGDFLLSYWFGLALVVGVRTYRELRDEKILASRLRDEWTHSRLQALRMQLNPHFLFNTLNAAVALVRSDAAAAEQILVRLGDLLRRTFRDGESDQLPLAREAEFVRQYLEIQSLRFTDRLVFDVQVPQALEDALVPGLLLQPLAENAIVHGVKNATDVVHVLVSARRERDELVMEVANTASAHRLLKSSRDGVGLGATRERLRTLFGEAQELTLSARPDGSVVARVRIPYLLAASGS
ncbi:MAG TPA: histidine kinase [Steroidobacteraceae bacterium]|nr:histidine kinase [Steroidobacteraceae bacterium]